MESYPALDVSADWTDSQSGGIVLLCSTEKRTLLYFSFGRNERSADIVFPFSLGHHVVLWLFLLLAIVSIRMIASVVVIESKFTLSSSILPVIWFNAVLFFK